MLTPGGLVTKGLGKAGTWVVGKVAGNSGRTATTGGAAVATTGQAVAALPKSGIYVINSSKGVYVGQSGNITRRLKQHVQEGRFTQSEVDKAARLAVKGGKLKREIAEQTMIDRLGGVGNLVNLRNPIGQKRFPFMPNQPYMR